MVLSYPIFIPFCHNNKTSHNCNNALQSPGAMESVIQAQPTFSFFIMCVISLTLFSYVRPIFTILSVSVLFRSCQSGTGSFLHASQTVKWSNISGNSPQFDQSSPVPLVSESRGRDGQRTKDNNPCV